MTIEQKNNIMRMRDKGYSYGVIAKEMDMCISTVKSFCQRKNALTEERIRYCPQCGIEVVQTKGRKEKKYCSKECRQTWWKAHDDLIQRRLRKQVVCAGCGKSFKVYSSVNRKYCSHKCYINHRFKGAESYAL